MRVCVMRPRPRAAFSLESRLFLETALSLLVSGREKEDPRTELLPFQSLRLESVGPALVP